ncbi:MAG: T9SS type A sorting domain-containing protein [Candidatus Kapabacteria bacterium]|nr:T9SS type A sorting domain-containing protein [Candidatus Kapabacteria bacterium]
MKKYLLLLTVAFGLMLAVNADAADTKTELKVLKKSELFEPPNPPFNGDGSSYPMPFTPVPTNSKYRPAISTGYYFADSDELIDQPWHPTPEVVDLSFEENNWRRIIRGPMLWKSSDAKQNVGPDGRPVEGYRFFHQPWQSLDPNDPNYSNGVYDSTNAAFAGPIPIGFNFVFGGLSYDSFYVSTNGVIALTNPRYLYNTNGDRVVSGGGDCYNTQSMDWYIQPSRSGDGLADTQVDDFGFRATAALMRTEGFRFNQLPNANPVEARYSAVIAPFWGKGYLSQWDKEMEEPRDWGQVHFYKNTAGNKLIIFYKNYTLVGSGFTTLWPYKVTSNTFAPNMFPKEDGYIGCDAQIVLDRTDSSVTFNYGQFRGRKTSGLYTNKSKDVFRWNTISGVYTRSRTTDYNSKTQTGVAESESTFPWGPDYPMWTTHWDKYETKESPFPNDHQAVKFKQWKNTLRYIDIQWRVRPRVKIDGEYSEEFSEEVKTEDAVNYELLAGHPQIGQIQPVVLVQNLTNDIQGKDGVNYQPQDFEFKVRMVIQNIALQKNIYNKAVKVDSVALATRRGEAPLSKVILSTVTKSGNNFIADNYDLYMDGGGADIDPENPPNQMYLKDDVNGQAVDGVPPYGFVQVYFPPFEPNEFFINNIGRMRATLTAEPRNPATNSSYKDMWPYDDQTSIDFFVMRRFEVDEEYSDDVTEWHQIPGVGSIPSVLKWVSIGAEVVSGEQVSRHALPPRGRVECANNLVFPGVSISSPTIKMNRPGVPMGAWGSDVIRSFPIDMTGKFGATLSLSVQRTTNPDGTDWTRGWSDGGWIGCEGRIVKDNWYSPLGGANAPDELRVEFALPSPDGVQGIANIDLYGVAATPDIQAKVDGSKRWRYHTRRLGAKAETGMSALALFGAGGYLVGFLESDRDSAMSMPSYSKRERHGLRENFYDDGIDYEYQRFIIGIPDTIINAPAEGAKNFRFRIQTMCKNHQQPMKVADDADDFYIDNVRILIDDEEKVDLELTSVSVRWPYTVTPASQAIEIPVTVKLTNNTTNDAGSFWVKLRIFDAAMVKDSIPYDLDPAYCRIRPVHMLRAGESFELDMPNWNARETRPGKYRMVASVFQVGGDIEPKNDTTYSDFETVFGSVFAYEPVADKENITNGTSNVDQYVGLIGRGLNLYGFAMGGTAGGGYDGNNWAAGRESGSGSGQIAMKFRLEQADTVYGFQAFYTVLNMAPDEITVGLYQGSEEESTPRDLIAGTEVYTIRGWSDIEQKHQLWDRYVTYLLPEPAVLKEGVYWVAIAQLGETGLELGASSSFAGMRIQNYYRHDLNPNDVRMNGSASMHMMIEKRFRKLDKNQNLVNDNVFAFENTKGSGRWEPFMPTSDNPGYGHNGWTGMLADGTVLFARGTWLPLLRPYLGDRLYAEDLKEVPCEDWIPVELTRFEGTSRGAGIDLIWETKSEVDNKGFYVEKRNSGTDEWSNIQFVNGNGTTNATSNYNYTDNEVVLNETYQYRLRQVDANGVAGCDDYSDVVSVTFENEGQNALVSNMPNPFTNSTLINYTLKATDNVSLEILDIYGNVVKNVNSAFNHGTNTYVWDARDNSGAKVSSGTYIYRLTVANDVMTRKMTLIK